MKLRNYPRYVSEDGFLCEVKGCKSEYICGTHWGDGKLWLLLCSEHYLQLLNGVSMPEIKQYALDRESKRDSITGILSVEGVNRLIANKSGEMQNKKGFRDEAEYSMNKAFHQK